jgi:iron complex outermembrane recepter protein
MYARVILLCLVITGLVSSPPPIAAQAESVLTGQVLDLVDDGRPVPGARVQAEVKTVDGRAGELRRATVTDRNGRFTLDGLPPGTYTLRIETAGYATAEAEVILPRAAPVALRLEPRPFQLEEVLATAAPTGGSVRYQPARAIDGNELARRMDMSLGTLLDGEPGVAMRSMGVAPARPVIRGFDGDRLVILEDGERASDLSETAADHAIALDPLAIRRVEVVRGPAALLYGSGALGGVVNLLTADLPDGWSRGWSGSLTSHGASMNRSAGGGANVTYGARDWAATGRLSGRTAGDLRTPEARLPGTHLRSLDGQVGVSGERGSVRGGIGGSFVDRAYGIPEAVEDPFQEVEIEMDRAALRARLEWTPPRGGWLEEVQLRFQGARFSQREWDRELGPSGLAVAEDLELDFLQRSGSVTLNLLHAPAGPFDRGAFGVSARSRTLDVGGDEAFTPGVRDGSLAAFSFQELPLAEGLRLQLGLRVEAQRSRARPNLGFPDAADRRSSFAYSGALGLNHRPADGWEVGIQVARAHRHPTLEELRADGPHLAAGAYEVGDPSLDDEVGHGMDLFVRRTGDRSSLEVAGFATRVDGFVAFQPKGRTDPASGLPVFRYLADDAQLLGGEITFQSLLSSSVRTGVGLDYVRGTRRGEDRVPLPTIPPLRGRLQVSWEPGAWWLGGTVRAVRAQRRVAPEEEPTGGYALVDLQAGVELDGSGRHLLTLRVDNLTDAIYRDHLTRVEERGFPMPGRNVNLIYRWSF